MKFIKLILFLTVASFMLSCENSITGQANLNTAVDSVAYIIGLNIGTSFKQDPQFSSLNLDIATIAKGIRDGMGEDNNIMSIQEGQAYMQDFLSRKQRELAAEKQEENKAFFEENKGKEGVVTLPSGLQYKIISEGEGSSPTAIDQVSVHYKGTLLSGEEFDSSSPENPVTFRVNQVIPGWTEALQLMKPGGKWELYIPPNLGYGLRGAGPGSKIGPEEALIFEVELVEVIETEKK